MQHLYELEKNTPIDTFFITNLDSVGSGRLSEGGDGNS
jgi:hypothetical protein